MEADGKVTDLVAKSVWLGCVRAKGCGLWKLYTTTGCNQTNHNSNKAIPSCMRSLRYAVPSSMQSPPVCLFLGYVVFFGMRSSKSYIFELLRITSAEVHDTNKIIYNTSENMPLGHALPSMRSPLICGPLRYVVPSSMQSPPVCCPLWCAVPSDISPLRYVVLSGMQPLRHARSSM